VASLERAHTAELDVATLSELRALLDAAFDGGFAGEEWEHALGGVHVIAREGADVVAHASVVQRSLVAGSLALRTGYVEAVAVRADRRGRGLGAAVMAAAESIVCAAYDLGALGAGENVAEFYVRRGWRPWEGPTWTLAPDGPRRTAEEDGAVLVLPTPSSPQLDLTEPLACDWRLGDVW
jgi:aminoglycoside 2'-N-acetyltransferase I